MDYTAAIEVIRERCLTKKHPTSSFVSICPQDFDPLPEPSDMLHFCQWLHEQGYTRSFPGKGHNGEWFIHPSPLALDVWDISELEA